MIIGRTGSINTANAILQPFPKTWGDNVDKFKVDVILGEMHAGGWPTIVLYHDIMAQDLQIFQNTLGYSPVSTRKVNVLRTGRWWWDLLRLPWEGRPPLRAQ